MKKIKVFLTDLCKKNTFLRFFLRRLVFFKQRITYLLYYFRKVDNKLIVFESFMGNKYCDSPKAIYEYLLNNKDYKDYKFVWFFKNPKHYEFLKSNPNTQVFMYGSKNYYKYYSLSKYWITNSRISDAIIKKDKQVYIQCWHGTPLKKLGFDIKVKGGNVLNSIKDIHYKYEVDSKKYSYMVSPSKFCSERFISAFNLKKVDKENIIIEKGYPRNDFLTNYTDKDVEKIKSDLKIPKDKKVILYAPTWRDNQHKSGVGYIYKTEVDFDYLKEKLSDKYVILFRAHYFVSNSFDFEKYDGFIYNVSNYDDINHIYIVSDLLITDYSSVFFDYAILKRPIIFYMYDLKEYKEELRDFYIDLNELPGNIVQNEKDLINEIKGSEKFKYDEKYRKFNEKFSYLEDGNATERVVKELIK